METSVTYDYPSGVVRVFTDREGVKNGFLRRIGNHPSLVITGNGPWFISVPMEFCRGPEIIARLLNEDERKPMTEAQKAALRAAR